MKNIKFEYGQTEELEQLIKNAYFGKNEMGENSNGKLNISDYHLTLNEDDVYYKVLTGLNYQVKLKNDLIEGHMNFDVVEHDSSIELVPSSLFCVKEREKYSFY